jgi:hypothetical protein
MWERPAGIWDVWPFNKFRRPVPIYVFVGYVRGQEQPLRICLPGDGSPPFVIGDPLDYDGGGFKHGPFATAARYDRENDGHTLAELFALLHLWATAGDTKPGAADQQALDVALDRFHAWMWHHQHRDQAALSGASLSG